MGFAIRYGGVIIYVHDIHGIWEWAIGPFFVSVVGAMKRAPDRLYEVIEPVVTGLGYELWGLEFHGQPRNSLLRIYIDHADGITVDDCQAVSDQVSGALDVEDPIKGHYTLEVSSPGMDRPLYTLEQFQRFVGQRVNVRVGRPLDGRRKFAGPLRAIEGDDLVIEVDGAEVRVPMDAIEQARLVPEF